MRETLTKKRGKLEWHLKSLETSLTSSRALLFINDRLDAVLTASWESDDGTLSDILRLARNKGATGVLVAIRRTYTASLWDEQAQHDFSQIAEYFGISLVKTCRWK